MIRLLSPLFILFALLIKIPLCSAFDTTAKQALIVDFDTDQVLFAKEAFSPMHPSSMTKIMTAYVVFDLLRQGVIKMEDEFTVSEKVQSIEGTRMFLQAGSKVSVQNLLLGLIVVSGNDASLALAEGISGSEEKFVELMNLTATSLKMKNTHFDNCTGLTSPQHYTTTEDLYYLSKDLITRFPEYYPMFAIRDFTYNKITQTNRNPALGHFGTDGIKTGRTQAGGLGIVLSFQENGRRIIAVINGCLDEKTRAEQSMKIIDYALNGFELKTLIDSATHTSVGTIEVLYGKSPSVELVPANDVRLYVAKDNDNEFRLNIKHPDTIKAPVQAGQTLGQLNVVDKDDQVIAEVDLVAKDGVPKCNILFKVIYNIKHLANRLLHKN